MEIVATTYLTLFLVVVLLCVRPDHQLAVVGITLPLGASAFINLPAFGNSTIVIGNVMAAFFLALVFIQRRQLVPRLLGVARAYEPGFYLIIFILIAILVTVLSPRLFGNTIEVFTMARGERLVGKTQLVPLRPTTANVTQSLYLLQGVIIFLVVAALGEVKSRGKILFGAIQACTVAHLAISVVDALENATGLELLAWLRTANYAFLDDVVFAGLPRLVGGFPEASVFGYFSLALFAFWFVYWRLGGKARYRRLYMLGSLAATIFSTSSGAFAALGVFLAITVSIAASDFLRRKAPTPTIVLVLGVCAAAPIAIAGFFIALQVSDGFYTYMDQLVFSKMTSSSGVERTSWNQQAMQGFYDSYLLGVGLGSIRGSSFFVSLLSTVGIFGAIAFFAFLYAIAIRKAPPQNSEYGALVGGGKAACLAMFLQANVTASNPDLGLLFFIFAAIVYAFSDKSVRVVGKNAVRPSGQPVWVHTPIRQRRP